MPATLQPCSACARHILSSEGSCPFCGQTQTGVVVRRRPLPKGRLSRAALVALGTLAASPTVACAGEDEDDTTEGDGDGDMSGDGDGDMSGDGDGDMSGDGDNPIAVYGAAPAGGTAGDGDASSSGGESAGTVYGAPFTGGAPGVGGTGDEGAGTGGDQLVPVYGLSPAPPQN